MDQELAEAIRVERDWWRYRAAKKQELMRLAEACIKTCEESRKMYDSLYSGAVACKRNTSDLFWDEQSDGWLRQKRAELDRMIAKEQAAILIDHRAKYIAWIDQNS